MWKFKKETFCTAIFGSREKGAWQESSKCTQEMHRAALQVLAVVGAAQGNGCLRHEICSVKDSPILERCPLCVTSRQTKFSRVYVCHRLSNTRKVSIMCNQ